MPVITTRFLGSFWRLGAETVGCEEAQMKETFLEVGLGVTFGKWVRLRSGSSGEDRRAAA